MKFDFNVCDYGAIGDGITLDTAAIQAAIDAATEKGGRVIIPPGSYLSGTIVLKSNVTLDLKQGSKLFGSPNIEDYITHTWGHHCDITPHHLILAEDAENIVITGEGEINGNGFVYWQQDRANEWSFYHEKLPRVSPMVHLHRCKYTRIENVTMRDSAGWTLHLHDCDHANIHAVIIRNTLFGPNTDGIDLSGCHFVTISDCDISTGDDAIALKTSEYTRSCEHITVTNCILKTSCVAVRMGYESRQDFRWITVTNCVVPSCSRVIDLRAVDGCSIEHVTISNIVGTTNSGWAINRPIEIINSPMANIFKGSLIPEHPDYGIDKPIVKIGVIRDITIRDVDIVTDGRVTIVASEGAEISGVLIDNLRLRYVLCDDPQPAKGPSSTGFIPGDHEDARGARAAIVAKNVNNLVMRDLTINWPEYPVPEDWSLLVSDNRIMTGGNYAGNEEKYRSGELRCDFLAFWGKNVTGGRVELGEIKASDGGEPTELVNSTIEIRTK